MDDQTRRSLTEAAERRARGELIIAAKANAEMHLAHAYQALYALVERCDAAEASYANAGEPGTRGYAADDDPLVTEMSARRDRAVRALTALDTHRGRLSQ